MKLKQPFTNSPIKAILLLLICLTGLNSKAQEPTTTETEKLEQRIDNLEDEVKVLKKLKVSGYIQAQYQYGEKDASLKVGSANENKEDGFNRFGIRRGRIKFVYEEGIASGVFQLDLTEKGVAFKDLYVNIKDPWIKTNAVRVGIFDRPFGYEISYSSSRRESPERSTIFQTLFPQERDLGAMLVLQPAKTSAFNFIKLEAGLFAGNGIKADTDNRKDFIGHLTASNSIGSNFKYGAGISYYYGSVYQGTADVYKMDGKSFVLDSNPANEGKFAKREYFGVDAELSLISILGMSKLTGEFLFGQQPGSENSTQSPNGNLPDYNTYIRNFNGGYVMLVQDIGPLPFSAIVKYDWYDPNTRVSGNEVGLNGIGKADASQNTIGVGAMWRANKNISLTAYYEFNNYEKTPNMPTLNELKRNVFTLRLQYKF